MGRLADGVGAWGHPEARAHCGTEGAGEGGSRLPAFHLPRVAVSTVKAGDVLHRLGHASRTLSSQTPLFRIDVAGRPSSTPPHAFRASPCAPLPQGSRPAPRSSAQTEPRRHGLRGLAPPPAGRKAFCTRAPRQEFEAVGSGGAPHCSKWGGRPCMGDARVQHPAPSSPERCAPPFPPLLSASWGHGCRALSVPPPPKHMAGHSPGAPTPSIAHGHDSMGTGPCAATELTRLRLSEVVSE